MKSTKQAPLIVHVIHRLHVGGLENGLVNLINLMPADRYRHAIVSMTDMTDFRRRIRRDGVECIALHQKPGKDFAVYYRLWRVFRRLKPDIVHTRNINTLEAMLPALMAGVRYRVHGEHGRNLLDLHGRNKKYLLLRKLHRPLVHRWVALSADMHQWLARDVRVPAARLVHIYNGVDINKFHPAREKDRSAFPIGWQDKDTVLIGTVGQLRGEKDQTLLMKAFAKFLAGHPSWRKRLKLVMIGEGQLRPAIEAVVNEHRLQDAVWLPGNRDDIDRLLPALDLFVLPSLGEGISNTILEAMACGLPVLATRVGGNPELVVEGETGMLVPSADVDTMAGALATYMADPDKLIRHGTAGRRRVENVFGLDVMVRQYQELYDQLLGRTG